MIIIIFIILFHNFFALSQSNDDRSAEYIVMPAGPVHQYKDGEIIAIAMDADGAIIAAAIGEGELPEGMVLADNGTILVVDHTQLVQGVHALQVVTVDEKGGMSTHQLTLSFLATGKADHEAGYKVYPPKPVDQYNKEEILLNPVDPDGEITSIRWIQGPIPPGTEIKSDGKMMVTNPKALEAGTYDMQLITYDESSGATLFSLTMTLLDKESASSK